MIFTKSIGRSSCTDHWGECFWGVRLACERACVGHINVFTKCLFSNINLFLYLVLRF